MVHGFEYNKLIKIGFLNEKIKDNLDAYKNNYDVILLNDVSMNYINGLVKSLVE
jgi:hypothetical protein